MPNLLAIYREKKNAHGIFVGFILRAETELATVLHSSFHFIFIALILA